MTNTKRRIKAHILINDAHDGQLGFLRRQNQFAHPAKGRILASPADADFQDTGQILRARKYIIAWFLVHRQGLTCDIGLVERALARDNQTIRRHVITGTDADHIAH